MAQRVKAAIKQAIKDEYIQGSVDDEGVRQQPSMRDLSRKYDVAVNSISRWAKQEDWVRERQQFQNNLHKKVKAKRIEKMVSKATKFDENCLTNAQEMLKDITRRLAEHQKFLDGDENAKELSVYHLRELSQTALNSQKLGRLALGEASEIHKGSIDVDGDEHFRRSIERLLALQNGRAETFSEIH